MAVAYGATFRVYTHDGDELADLAGRLRHDATGRRDLPAVGDWVAVKRTTIEGGRATIQGVLPRKSLFSRKAAGDETTEQILAANVDTAFLITGLDRRLQPAPDRALSRDDLGEWREPCRRLQQGRSRGRLRRYGETRCRRSRWACRSIAISARQQTGLDAARPLPAAGTDDCRARIVRRRQVHVDQSASSARSGCARGRSAKTISVAGTPRRIASWFGCRVGRC